MGREQAAAVAVLLAAARPAVVLASDLVRARDTARPLAAAAGVEVREDPRLRELDLGAWQGLTSEQARERFPDEHAAWRAGHDVPRGGGETYRQAGERGAACLREALPALPEGGVLVAVTHGGTARGVLGALLGSDPATWWQYAPLGNCCWSVLVEHPRGWRLDRHAVGLESLAEPATWAPAVRGVSRASL